MIYVSLYSSLFVQGNDVPNLINARNPKNNFLALVVQDDS